MGHTDSFFGRCWTSVQSQFLDHPTRAPDASRIENMPNGEFVIQK
jgi:hypothetical protein